MAYGLTQSCDFTAASSERAEKTSGLTGFPSGASARTFEGWIKYNGTVGQYCFGHGSDSGTGTAFSIWIENGATDGIWLRTNGGRLEWNSATICDGNWHHIAITHDGSTPMSGTTTKCYQNGVALTANDLVGSGTVNTNNARIRIGTGDSITPGSFWDGNLSLVRLWTVARTQSEIVANACNVLGATTNLKAEYKLDGDYTDNTGGGFDLTAYNTPAFVSDVPSTCTVAGPTTVKTVDGVTVSSQLKTLDAVALASIKSINGNT